MAVKKAMVKAKAKKAPGKKAASRGKTKAGDALVCGVCGMSVTVDEICGCVESHDIICCERPMKKRSRR
jgi:hypothetical protein